MMRARSNLHTHTTYCDGKSTPREMIEAALQCGFESLGFSSHAPNRYGESYCMNAEGMRAYFAELEALKAEYADRITIFTGLENDGTDPADTAGCDFVIGSIHFFACGDGYADVDDTKEALLSAVQEHLGGDMLRMARSYYELLTGYALRGSFDILGHFDLLTKFNADGALLDVSSKAYRDIAFSALDAIAETGKLFEVNTGAISRGFTRAPYPARFLLERLYEKRARLILSSDAHSADGICAHFEQAEEMLREIGFRTLMQLTERGFVEVPL